MAFDGVLTPESASFAGQAATFGEAWHARAPRNPRTDFPLRDRRSRRLPGSLSGPVTNRQEPAESVFFLGGIMGGGHPRTDIVRRDHCGGSDPPEGRGKWWAPLTPPRWRTSAEKGGVAPSTSSPSRAAPRRAVRGGDARCRRRTRLYPGGFGESVPTRVQCGFPGTAWTTTARASPSDSADL